MLLFLLLLFIIRLKINFDSSHHSLLFQSMREENHKKGCASNLYSHQLWMLPLVKKCNCVVQYEETLNSPTANSSVCFFMILHSQFLKYFFSGQSVFFIKPQLCDWKILSFTFFLHFKFFTKNGGYFALHKCPWYRRIGQRTFFTAGTVYFGAGALHKRMKSIR